MAPLIDDSLRPILVVTFDGAMTDVEFADYLKAMTRMGPARREKNVVILDATRSAAPTASQRKMQADWLREQAPLLKRYSLGTAFVVPSALVRGALTAILWMQPMDGAHTVCSSLGEAMQWARLRVAASGAPA